jgi:hypothetical protein
MGSQEECKYAHLLQPIRDLAANWDINIASELEEYLVTFIVANCGMSCPHGWEP